MVSWRRNGAVLRWASSAKPAKRSGCWRNLVRSLASFHACVLRWSADAVLRLELGERADELKPFGDQGAGLGQLGVGDRASWVEHLLAGVGS